MSELSDPIERMQQCIDSLESPIASTFYDALNDIRTWFARQTEETKRLSEAQANAIVNSAEIISQLEETKANLEASRIAAEVARKQAQELSAFGSILDRSLNEIYIFDAETLRFIHANRGARENLGYSMEELQGLTPLDIKPEQTPTTFSEMVAPLRAGTKDHVDFVTVHRRKDGSEYPVQVHLEAAVQGERPVFVAIVLDITERLRIEAELRDSKERALAADRSKSEFLANMSHEIRTPMTAILGFADVLAEPGVSDQERLDAVKTIQRNGQHLLELINDILDLSKVESGKFVIEKRKHNPAETLRDVQELLAERAQSQGNDLRIELRGNIPQTIRTDPTRLKQALVNLVGNAIKFTRNGSVRVVAECDRQRERMSLHVIDSGVGMTSEQIGRIFQPFRQADASTTRKYGGTGLGLTITKRIAELLGGNVSVESEPGVGSTFTLTIATGPLTDVQMLSTLDDGAISSVSTSRQTSANSENRIDGRVLLVEDGPDNQRLVSFVLKKAGAAVTIAENGKLGVDAAMSAFAEGKPFDVILMDMQMPVMDGYTATSTLRNGGYTGQIVALTAHAMKGEIDKCLASGCDAYLSKPIDRKTLIAEVAARMGKPSEKGL